MSRFSVIQEIIGAKQKRSCPLISPAPIESFVQDLFRFLFLDADLSVHHVEKNLSAIQQELHRIIDSVSSKNNPTSVDEQSERFIEALPTIYHQSVLDAEAIFQTDPAAKTIDEVFIAYPSFFATFIHRVAHQFYIQNLYLLSRLFSEYAHSKTGIDIHPGATIGNSFAIDHGTGIVIGETAIIGKGVKIYQGVTLGALSVLKEKASEKRHPSIEDNVVIYAGATILGGNTVIGHDSIIGGNVWITQSVAAHSIVYHEDKPTIEDRKSFKAPIDFII